MTRFVVILLICLGLAACGPSNLPASSACKVNDECAPGLSCANVDQLMPGGMCMTVGKNCTTTCVQDINCVPLGPDFKCLAGCTGTSFCEKVKMPM
jgi:hypothetical protein